MAKNNLNFGTVGSKKVSTKMTFKADFKTPTASLDTSASKKERVAATTKMTKAVTAASRSLEPVIIKHLNDAMDSQVFSWNRPTKRRNGTWARTPRDIVDTGALKRSLKLTTKYLKTKTTFNVSYLSPYAWITHEGGYVQPYGNRQFHSVYILPRPWVRGVLEGGVNGITPIDIESAMTGFIRAALES